MPYHDMIITDTKCPATEAPLVDDIMREIHPTLDGLSRAEFRRAARKAYRTYHAYKEQYDRYYSGIQAFFAHRKEESC